MNLRCRNYILTINNPSKRDYCTMITLINKEYVSYVCYQIEKVKTIHIQGYIELNRSVKGSVIIKLFDQKPHLERRRGSQKQAIAYVTKKESRVTGPFQWGEFKKQGKRTDLERYRNNIIEGFSDKELIMNNINEFAKFPKLVNKVRSEFIFKPKQKVIKDEGRQVFYLYGETGSGKTKYVYDHYKVKDIYKLESGTGYTSWFDGYNGEKVLLIDDFYGWLRYDFLLRITDRYPMKVQTKGGYVEFCSPIIFITSNKRPDELYPNIENKSALLRRLKLIYI